MIECGAYNDRGSTVLYCREFHIPRSATRCADAAEPGAEFELSCGDKVRLCLTHMAHAIAEDGTVFEIVGERESHPHLSAA